MTKSKRLQPIANLAERREQDAARRLGECFARARERQAKLDELCGYRDEYHTRYEQMTRAGMNAATIQRFRGFLQQLDVAIDHQRGLVTAAARESEEMRQIWASLHSKTLSLDKAIENMRHDEGRQEARREQREADDRAPRAWIPEDPDTLP